jgi:polyisoprenoid-binding protein YceI
MNHRAVVAGGGWLLAAMLAAAPAGAATAWTTAPASSRLNFTATQAGGEFDGQFRRFHADIAFDPADLAGSHFRVVIETASADTQEKERDTTLAGSDFFAADRWPTATYEAGQFVTSGPGQFEARGKLTIRGITRDVPVTFAFKPAADGRSASLTGGTTIRRLDFGVGQGQWQDTQWVGNEVRIRFELVLKK